MTEKKMNSCLLDEIIYIEDIGKIDTYDFTVPITHCFFANGILVHNCIEESSDKCILLHWEYFYNKDAEKNNYKIILAKNRNGATGVHEVSFDYIHYKFNEKTWSQTIAERESDEPK